MEGALPFCSRGMQNLARRFSCRPKEAMAEPASSLGMRAVLPDAERSDRPKGIAGELGFAGVLGATGRDPRKTQLTQPADSRRPAQRNELVARQPAASGSTHRTAEHYGLSEMEKPAGYLQRRNLSHRSYAARGRAESAFAGGAIGIGDVTTDC